MPRPFEEQIVELYARFHGTVQGVGFRWTVQDAAESLDLCGTVRNLPDGTVEAIVQGERLALEQLINSIQRSSGAAVIQSTDILYRSIQQRYNDFRIIH
jgi:acylphosphatase